MLNVEKERAAVLVVEEFKRAFEVRAADSLQSDQYVVKDVTAHEVYTLLRLLRLCSFSLTVQAHLDRIVVYFSFKFVCELKSKDEFITILYGLDAALGRLTSLYPDDLIASKWIKLGRLTEVYLGILSSSLSQHLLL